MHPMIPYVFMKMTSVTYGDGTPLQCSCLENPMDGGAWWAAVHGVAKSRTRLSDFTSLSHTHNIHTQIILFFTKSLYYSGKT